MNKTWIPIAALAILLAAVPAASADNWSRSVDGPIEAATLGLPADASAQRLGKAAIAKHFRKLGDVRYARTVVRGDGRAGATPMQGLRFRQTLGGLRVLWSEIDVAVTRGAVQSMSGTVVPLKSRALAGERRVSAAQARAIAREAVPGADIVRPAEFIAYAGEPGKPRAARRAYVVEVYRKADRDEHSQNALCVVVDAENGRVLKTWEGFAAREPESGGRRRARAAATKTYLTQFVDAGGKDVSITNNFRQTFTTGNPYLASGYVSAVKGKETTGVLSQTLLRVIADTNNVTEFICLVRRFCGRDSGSDGSYNRHFVTGNWVGSALAQYRHSQERVYFSAAVGDNNDEGTIAHEFGHQADARFQNDYTATVEADEVDEALAEMFAYDYERDSKDFLPDDPSVKKVLANPGVFKIDNIFLPSKQSSYICTAGLDEHINGYILGHAYFRLVSRIGHNAAGDILQFVPWRLPAKRTFGAVREAFERIAEERWGASTETHVDAVFNELGVADGSSRTSKCPGATP